MPDSPTDRTLTRRHLVSGARPYRVALAGWLPALLVGVVQAAALFLVVRFALGLRPVHPLGMFGFMCLTAVAFTALVLNPCFLTAEITFSLLCDLMCSIK